MSKFFLRFVFNTNLIIHCLKIRYKLRSTDFKNWLMELEHVHITPNSTKLNLDNLVQKIIRINNFLGNNTCLKSSICIYTFMHSHGLDPILNIGVKKNQNGEFLSHSWVEFNNKPLGEKKDVESYKIIYSKQ